MRLAPPRELALLAEDFAADFRDFDPLDVRLAALDPRLDEAERPALAPRERLEAPRDDADLELLDLLPFALLLLALRDEALLRDLPRDFLPLVAIDASPRRQ